MQRNASDDFPVHFEQTDEPRIYLAPQAADAHLHCAYVLPKNSTSTQNTIDMAAAFTDGDGSFCFSTIPIDATILAELDSLHGSGQKSADATPQRFIVWICETPSGTTAPKTVISFASGAGGAMTLTMPLVVVIETGHLNAHIPLGSAIAVSDQDTNSIVITPGNGPGTEIHGLAAFQCENPQPVNIDFQGANRGFPRFRMDVDVGDLLKKIPVGFRYTVPDENNPNESLPLFFSLFEAPAAGTRANMELVIDPFTADYDIEGLARSSITFVGANGAPPGPIRSTYRSREGHPICLQPATASEGVEGVSLRFASHGANPGFLYFDPAGDFWPTIDAPASTSICDFMCGLSATEIIRLKTGPADASGDRLRFVPGKPANAPQFPLPTSSTMAAPRSPDTPLLDEQVTASWVAAIPGGEDGIQYAAQPSASALYGKDATIYANNDHWLGFVEPGISLDTGSPPAAPVLPYIGLKSNAAAVPVAAFEDQLILPTRHRAFMDQQPTALQQILHSEALPQTSAALRATTTAGLIVTVGTDGRWSEVCLALSNHGQDHLRFLDLSSELQQVFQAKQVFAVLVNPAPVGTPGQSPGFDNAVNMDGWTMSVDVGTGSDYAHYANVMVLKFCAGRLTDLVKNTTAWNNGAVLSVQDPQQNPLEITAVSQWLQDYIVTAQERQDEGKKYDETYAYYENFLALAEDENWTGVLALKVDITSIPAELQGLLDGIDTSEFFAHHIGVDINPVEGTDIELKQDSALFGLIDYTNPRYRPETPDQPIPAQSEGAFEFTVLTLQALFENASVKAFSSKAQLTITELFGAAIDKIVDDNNNTTSAVILDGRYQKHGETTGFVMETQAAAVAHLQSTVLPRACLSSIQFTTVDNAEAGGAAGGRSHVRFNFSGALDFIQLESTDELPANDIFSFGHSDSEKNNAGLPFSNLMLDMLPDRDEQGGQQFAFNIADVRFSTDRVAARDNSLYQAFPLSAGRLLGGPGAASPAAMGYLPVGGDTRFGDVGDSWYGISFQLDLGTPGELASQIGFEADLLLAWEPVESSDTSHIPAFVGLKLPGTEGVGALGLQGIIKVTIDDIELLPIADETKGTTYLLKLQDIALSLMGLKKIPSSSGTTFYLFASPERSAGKSALGWYAIYNPNAKSDA